MNHQILLLINFMNNHNQNLAFNPEKKCLYKYDHMTQEAIAADWKVMQKYLQILDVKKDGRRL